jgi:hypothetical protein
MMTRAKTPRSESFSSFADFARDIPHLGCDLAALGVLLFPIDPQIDVPGSARQAVGRECVRSDDEVLNLFFVEYGQYVSVIGIQHAVSL